MHQGDIDNILKYLISGPCYPNILNPYIYNGFAPTHKCFFIFIHYRSKGMTPRCGHWNKRKGYNHTFVFLVTMAIWQYEQVIVITPWFPLETSLRCGTCNLSPWPGIVFIGWCLVSMLFLTEQSLVLFGVQHVPDLVWKLIDWKAFNWCDETTLTC